MPPRPALARPADLRRLVVQLVALTSAACHDGGTVVVDTDGIDTAGFDTDLVDTETDSFDTDVAVDTDPFDTDVAVETDLFDTDPIADTDPADTDPIADTDPADTDPVVDTDPVDSDPVVDTDAETDPVVDTDPVDTDTLPLVGPTCVSHVWHPLSALSTPEPHVHLRLVASGAQDTAWWPDTGSSVVIADEIGTPCADAADTAACLADLDAAGEALTERALISTDGGTVHVWSGAAVDTVLGAIDTLDEAMLRVWIDEGDVTCWNTVGRPITGGYEVVRQVMASICPITYEDVTHQVASDGTVTYVDTVPSSDTGGGCIGRRPPGLRLVDVDLDRGLGARLARHAALEAASVAAFDQLDAELTVLGAPDALLKRVRAAARDERRHAGQVGALARRYGVEPEVPVVAPTPLRDAEAIALDNAVEGCVGETWGALVGTWQAQHASDPVVAATLRRIARDEVRHAALSWAIDAWLDGLLDDRARARVAAARAGAIDRLRARARRDASPVVVDRLGEPDVAAAVALADALATALAA